MALGHNWRRLRGLLRSLKMYYWPPGGGQRIDAFYGSLLPEKALCFDVGAHVGNRTLCWLRLGFRVVAVEPQPDFARFLRVFFYGHKRLTILESAIAREPGDVSIYISTSTPTVSSGSQAFIEKTSGEIPSFGDVVWNEEHRVNATTLQELIVEYGSPDFIKLDIEGMEAEALAGLREPVPLLSFEFLAGRVDDAFACLDQIARLGSYQFNLSIGESLKMEFDDWQDRQQLAGWLDHIEGQDFSGDIYAKLGA